jgi:PPOX class probable F420-dependent enzyme
MHKMSPEEWRAFLSDGTRTAKVATTRKDGRPHIMPVWFVLDGDQIVFTTAVDSVKGQNIRRDPRVAVCVDLEQPPYAFVVVEGGADVSEDLGEVRRFATLIGSRYMGADRAEEFGARNGVPGEMLVRVRPEKVLAVDALAD